MTFNLSEITYDDSIKIGSDDAPLKIVEYINLRCPYSKAYEETVAQSLNEWIKKGKVQRVIKHFDKEKESLEAGNIFNQYINYETPEESYSIIQKIFEQQEDWGKNRLAHIPHFAQEIFGLQLQRANKERSERILDEVQAVNVELIPTIFVGDEAFVGTVDEKEFHKAIKENI